MANSLAELYSPEYTAELRKRAEEQLAPSLGLQNQALDLSLQDLSNQETQVNRSADTLADTLRKQAIVSTRGLEERQNQLGLLQSGMTAAGLGDIQKTLNKNIGQSEQDRAAQLATLALQRSGYGLKRAEIGQQYQASISDLVNQLLAKDVELYKATHPASSGSSVSNPFAGLFGNAQPAQPTPEVPKIGNFTLDELRQNQISGTNDFIVRDANGNTAQVTREQLADIIATGSNNQSARNTQGWWDVYNQILQNFGDIPKPTKQQITSNLNKIIMPSSSTTRRGF